MGYGVQSATALLLDGMAVFDRVIKVNMARGGSGPGVVRSLDPDRVQRTVHVGGLPFDEISEETLSDYFHHVGEVSIHLELQRAAVQSTDQRFCSCLPSRCETTGRWACSSGPGINVMRRQSYFCSLR